MIVNMNVPINLYTDVQIDLDMNIQKNVHLVHMNFYLIVHMNVP